MREQEESDKNKKDKRKHITLLESLQKMGKKKRGKGEKTSSGA